MSTETAASTALRGQIVVVIGGSAAIGLETPAATAPRAPR
jgi:hypothetical protein